MAAPAPPPGAWTPPSSLPPLYARWITDLLGGPITRESQATCEQCAMLPPPGARGGTDLYFNAETKCCTYVPALPNYLVGRALGDGDPALAAGRASLERRIADRVGVTPLGLDRPPVHRVLYRLGGPAGAFGRSRALRCPHYLAEAGGACGIWRHRNGVCSTWFCKHVRGATGQRFWHGLEQLLTTVERELARWCLVRLELDPRVLARLLPRGTDRGTPHDEGLDAAAIDARVDDETYRALWGAWRHRERALYLACARLVDHLGWKDVLQIGGGSLEAHARIVAGSYRDAGSESLPDRLVLGPLQTLARGRNHVRVSTYNALDPLELPRLLMDVLPYFDGRPTGQVLRQIRAEKRLNLQPDLLRRLVDFAVLLPAP